MSFNIGDNRGALRELGEFGVFRVFRGWGVSVVLLSSSCFDIKIPPPVELVLDLVLVLVLVLELVLVSVFDAHDRLLD